MVTVSSWGRLSNDQHEVIELSNRNPLHLQLKSHHPGIAYGLGKSYGDVCLNPNGVLWNTAKLDRFISFDENTGILVCESGALLKDIQNIFIPKGWNLPVTPGTNLITVGGAIANDVHGKNHHVEGTFGNHVQRIVLCRTDGTYMECGPGDKSDWFCATVGGLGLTGIITRAELQLKRMSGPWLKTETVPYSNLDQFLQLAASSESEWEHTVSWFDCTSTAGRGLFMRANSCTSSCENNQDREPNYRQWTIPFTPPLSLLNNLTVRTFNSVYYFLKKRDADRHIQHYSSVLYPLDRLLKWNRMYGVGGFYQYQSVIPKHVGQDATQAMFNEIKKSKQGSFLSVLKTFGDKNPVGMLSFPMPGITLALDFPNRGNATAQLFERLDSIVRDAGGRIYPAKDARMPRDLFENGYPRLGEFLQYRDPGISSALSRRLMGN